jgi:hypothetical protein
VQEEEEEGEEEAEEEEEVVEEGHWEQLVKLLPSSLNNQVQDHKC